MNNRCFSLFPSRLPSSRDVKLASYLTLATMFYLMNAALAGDMGCERLIVLLKNAEFLDYFALDTPELAPGEDKIAADLQAAGICSSDRMINCEALSKNEKYRGYMSSLFEVGFCQPKKYAQYNTVQQSSRTSGEEIMSFLAITPFLIAWSAFLIGTGHLCLCIRDSQPPSRMIK